MSMDKKGQTKSLKEKTRKLLIILGGVLISLLVLAMAKDFIIKSVISAVATHLTGARIGMRAFSFGIFRQSIRIRDFRMYNPKGFPKGVLVELPRVNVDYDFVSLIKGKAHLKLLEVDLKEIVLVINEEGRLNVDSLKIAQHKDTYKTKPKKPLKIQIDLLNLNIGKIVSKDYSAGPEPQVKAYDINIKKSYRNITSVEHLAVLILTEPMKEAGIKGAAIYGIAAMTVAGIIPVAVVSGFAGRDSSHKDFDVNIKTLFDITREVLKKTASISKEEKDRAIYADVSGARVTVKFEKIASNTTRLTVSARKYMLPKPEIANGILYEITERLRK